VLWLDRSGGLMGGQGLEEGRRRQREDGRRRRWLGFGRVAARDERAHGIEEGAAGGIGCGR
jgi:hypothetical protein